VSVFSYPTAARLRRHGPRGYADYKHYKPWLRDEFTFRCIYCLCRETWLPDGQAHFSVDHVSPRDRDPGTGLEYDRLVYACSVCNACKGDFPGLVEIGGLALSEHLAVNDNGVVEPLSRFGETVVDVCALNRPELVAFRRDLLASLAILERSRAEEAARLRRRYLGYPDDLPDLGALRPPEGNARPEGIASSAFERRRRGELPDRY
jgi:hypothetical protein